MKLITVNSGSSGNSYLLTDSKGSILLLEAGMHPDEVYRAMDFNIGGLQGVCVSHSHR